ncbi:MAG: hypothetical protein ABSH20_06095 [Tepidisphaeraceae bacterium]|jgi:hypothetical protein
MPDVDLFTLYRWLLAWVVTVYCTVLTVQWAWTWYVWLSSSDRYIAILRRYIIVAALRMKFRTFWGELLICLLLSVAFGLMCKAQYLMSDIEQAYGQARGNTHRMAPPQPKGLRHEGPEAGSERKRDRRQELTEVPSRSEEIDLVTG